MPMSAKRALLFGSAVLTFAAFLSGHSARLAAQTPEIGASPPQDVMPLAPHGLANALTDLPGTVATIMDRSKVPGVAVAVVHGGQTIFAQGFGVRKLGESETVDPQTVFQIASISKSITATVAALMVTKGAVSWDDPIVKHMPGFKLQDAYVASHATIGDFFAHRSGLPGEAGDELEDLGYERREIISRLAQLPLDRFRASYHYANFGTTIAAEAITSTTAGETWEGLAERVFFTPLGMKLTSYRHADYLARSNRAVLHAFEGGRFQPLYDRNPDAQAPAGGVSSNVIDLASWLKLLLADGELDGKPFIASDALLTALTPQTVSAPSQALGARSGFYGYGFNVGINPNGRVNIGHSGAFLLGAGTVFYIVPSADIGIVVLTNGAPVGAAEAIALQFLDTVQYGKPTRDWFALFQAVIKGLFDPEGDLAGKNPPSNPAPARDLASYAGRYENSYFGPATVSVEGDHLRFVLGPQAKSFPLSHWNGDTFALSLSGENAPAGSRSSVRFTGSGGPAGAFTVEFFNNNGMGTWRR